MKNHQTDDPSRVHMRAFARLQYLHEAISSGRHPSIQDLALSADRNPRTIKRDVKALRDDFKAPLVYDRKRKGFRYADSRWQLPPARLSEGELLWSAFPRERPHQDKGNVMLMPLSEPRMMREGSLQCRERLGGLLKYYHPEAA